MLTFPIIGIISAIIIGVVVFISKKKENNNNVVSILPNTSGRPPIKRALLVGINKYKPELGADLRGCVNDVENMQDILVNIFKFDSENIQVLTNERATKQGILDGLRWLLNGSKEGDELVFHYSGHGSQIMDKDGDESDDQLDEILCPHDLDWNDPLTDDNLAVLFKQLPEGVHLTMLCDSCHSATISREVNISNPHRNYPKNILPPSDIRSRTYGKILYKNKMGKKNRGVQNHMLMSGCKDDQTSADAYIDGKYQGAFTWALSKTIRENPDIEWQQAHVKTVELLNGYSQSPQLSGSAYTIFRKVFGGK